MIKVKERIIARIMLKNMRFFKKFIDKLYKLIYNKIRILSNI